jgi:hypothetical protein
VIARAYDLIVFPGHHEYVTEREYDAIERYRNLGGNLMFLSANNFFWKVAGRGNLLIRVKQWRDLGRPEAALVGVQYFANDRGQYRAPWIVRNTQAAGGLLSSAGLREGATFAYGGVEVDSRTQSSPAGTEVLAELTWRNGRKAHMTYYENARGAKVFAAGAFSLAWRIHREDVARVMDELWKRLARP